MIASNLSKWMTPDKFFEVTGESKNTVDKLISSGSWADGIHYRVRGRRRRINLEAYYRWVEKGV